MNIRDIIGDTMSARQMLDWKQAQYDKKRAEDEAAYSEEWRPDLLQALIGGVTGFAGSGGNPLGALAGAAGGLTRKAAVNRRGGTVNAPADTGYLDMYNLFQNQDRNKSRGSFYDDLMALLR